MVLKINRFNNRLNRHGEDTSRSKRLHVFFVAVLAKMGEHPVMISIPGYPYQKIVQHLSTSGSEKVLQSRWKAIVNTASRKQT